MSAAGRRAIVREVRVDRYGAGPGEMLCDNCGHLFDPIATRWMCPHCHVKWPCCDGAPLPPRPPLRG